MTSAQLINQTSGSFEWYTPPEIIKAARATMGGIDLDPASSCEANRAVQAGRFFGLQKNAEFIDGLDCEWRGRIWLNHPFGRGSNGKWIEKLLREIKEGRVAQACCITYACTSEAWFRPLFSGSIQCWLSPRTNYLLPDGTVKRGVTKGSVVTYFGNEPSRFAAAFVDLGAITSRWSFVSAT